MSKYPFISLDISDVVIIAQAKHEAFIKARGRHYSNEAEAMKVSCVSLLFHLLI